MSETIHVVPASDTVEHDTGGPAPGCRCRPPWWSLGDRPEVVVHNRVGDLAWTWAPGYLPHWPTPEAGAR